MSYRRPVPNIWWLKRRPYSLFMVRELTSVAVAGYCAFLLFLVYRLGQGAQAYSTAIDRIVSPLSIALHLTALALALYHTITTFNFTPRILVFRIGEERVPGVLIAGAHYAGWIILSALIAWTVLGAQ